MITRRQLLGAAGLVAAAAATGPVTGAVTGAADVAWAAPGRRTVDVQTRRIGTSVMGRPLVAHRLAQPGPVRTRYLVIGCMHGDEPAGTDVVRHRLLRATPPAGVALWLVPTLNPDGLVRGTRVNARSVDLNRNFPAPDWRLYGVGTSTYSGPRPASEPETRAALAFLDEVRPHTVVSLHQPFACVDTSGNGDPGVSYWLARHLGLPTRDLVVSGGTLTGWFNHRFPQRTAVTVELPQPAGTPMRRRLADVLVEHAGVRDRHLAATGG